MSVVVWHLWSPMVLAFVAVPLMWRAAHAPPESLREPHSAAQIAGADTSSLTGAPKHATINGLMLV